MRQRVVLLMFLLSACGPPSGASDAATANQSNPATPAGCADHLLAELDRQSFQGAGIGASPADLDRWLRESAAAFKAAASPLCAQGKLLPAELAPFKQLVVQYGGGADSAAVWVDEARPTAIILQYAFSPGSPAPSAEEAGEALSCWNDPELPVCAERMP